MIRRTEDEGLGANADQADVLSGQYHAGGHNVNDLALSPLKPFAPMPESVKGHHEEAEYNGQGPDQANSCFCCIHAERFFRVLMKPATLTT